MSNLHGNSDTMEMVVESLGSAAYEWLPMVWYALLATGGIMAQGSAQAMSNGSGAAAKSAKSAGQKGVSQVGQIANDMPGGGIKGAMMRGVGKAASKMSSDRT